MDEEKRFYQKPGFNSLVLGILLLVIYGIEYKYEGGVINLPGISFDLVLLFFLIQIAVAFYAQFVLPIHRRGDRRKVIDRLWLHAMGEYGPAISVWFKSLVLGILLLGIYWYKFAYQGSIMNIPSIVFDLVLLLIIFQLAVAFYAQFVLPTHQRGDCLNVIDRLWLHPMSGLGLAIFAWFKSLVLGILLLGVYGYEYVYQGGMMNIPGIVFDLIWLFFIFQLAVAFYAQFVLPIHIRGDRLNVIDRLWFHPIGAHGPAIFVKNGRLVESKDESKKKGPGVLWLDTASAVVTRTDTILKNVLEPGVHFTDEDEKIASVISLHTQSHSFGPEKNDDPFKPAKDYAPEEDYEKVHDRKVAVSAMTRDGIEVVPTISVTFKIDAAPATGKEKGSRFGFDKDAVEKAARGEGINAGSGKEESKHVAWNKIPALIAADLWREYLNKFTLNELFSASLKPPSDVPQPEPSADQGFAPLHPIPIRVGFLSRLLRRFNNSFEKRLKELAPEEAPKIKTVAMLEDKKEMAESKPQTALQIINQMIKARMTQANVPALDECGRQLEGFQHSQEFTTLTERGIKVFSVSVSFLRFDKSVEEEVVQQWNTSWLQTALADRNRIERLTSTYSNNGRQKALREHALTLSNAINTPPDIAMAVKSLLQQMQMEIKQINRLLRRSTNEAQAIDNIINWMESKDL